MSLRLKLFIMGTFIVGLLVCSIFLFIPKQKNMVIMDAPLLQTPGK